MGSFKARALQLASLLNKFATRLLSTRFVAGKIFILFVWVLSWRATGKKVLRKPLSDYNITIIPHYSYFDTTKVAVLTAVFGDFEKSLKPVVPQTVEADFFCFTDRTDLRPLHPWVIDNYPYHFQFKPPFYSTEFVNAFEKHEHPHNLAKYYKQQFHRIPYLRKYEVIIWIDSSFEISSCLFVAHHVMHLKESGALLTAYEHPFNTDFYQEATWSMGDRRWKSTSLRGMKQPFQDVLGQANYYLSKGFSRDYFKNLGKGYGHYGLWNGGITGWNMSKPSAIPFLDLWFLQNLNFTTQDQISLPYVAWTMKEEPESLPYNVYFNGLVTFANHGK